MSGLLRIRMAKRDGEYGLWFATAMLYTQEIGDRIQKRYANAVMISRTDSTPALLTGPLKGKRPAKGRFLERAA
jgi:7,8-dihydro-6-hydroxymethylpterin-pyrophosphokinase